MNDEEFLKKFETAEWPLAEWHHEQHIKIAYLYLRRYPFDEAMNRLRERIKAYNNAQGIPDTPTRGYHETMTGAWMRLVHLTLQEYGPAATADEFWERSPQLSEKKILRLFYSREIFMSPRAKVEFMEPDLGPFPKSCKSSDPA